MSNTTPPQTPDLASLLTALKHLAESSRLGPYPSATLFYDGSGHIDSAGGKLCDFPDVSAAIIIIDSLSHLPKKP